MDCVKSTRRYGKVDESQDLALKKKKRKRLISVAAISVVILIAIIIASVVSVVIHNRKHHSPNPTPSLIPELTPAASLRTVCSVTHYPTSCFSSISKIPSSNTTDPEILFRLSLKVVVNELASISDLPKKLSDSTNDQRIKSAISVCVDLMEDAIDRVNDTVSAMEIGDGNKILNASKIDDLKTWLSAALTDYETCFDALDEFSVNKTDSTTATTINLKSAMRNSIEFTSNSLAIVAKVLSMLSDFGIPIHRRRLLNSDSVNSDPDWVSLGVRRLLQVKNLTPNVTVAADGSGDVKTVNEAVARVPSKGKLRYVIYVKEGVYVENVVMDKSKWNVMIYGDGKEKTIISGNKSNADGIPTFKTATFAIQGQGFIMKDIGIINTAGAANHQAVAFRSGSDLSVYYQCSFDGYQNTLYPHSNRQFYRECDITGTVDFIFGNAAVVFQRCNIQPRQPLPNQVNTITAQGKTDSNQNTGISIQRCTISAANGNVTAPTYFGRPWKEFSTTVIMQSEVGSIVRAAGWLSWVLGTDPPSSILYGEYKNSGSGSGLNQRIKWAGYKPILSDAEARRFTVATFIRGGDWLPATGVQYQPT
ncbi:hypothetical protein AALP_AA3G161400 [Arabis alpina]|uniref:Pectinesterase n=1 Tax=Arabis alpina TaxID=50452 RepID=A0A087H9J4_ARAAL|nr:hypothetical protein AALP_AA3G161400 [Arabis alpina]